MIEHDYIVIGAGSAGAVLASRLARAGKCVLLLESGERTRSIMHRMPVAFPKLWFKPETSWSYWTDPEAGLNGRKMPVPRGRGLGGSSSINGMLFNRGSTTDWDNWSALGLQGWDFQSMLPYFRRVESFHDGSSPLHGDSGPVQINRLPCPSPLSETVLNAAHSFGFPVTRDFAGEQPEGWGIPDLTISKRGRRVSSADAYLEGQNGLSTLTIQTGALVRKILFEGTSATGVEYERDGAIHRASAKSEILLAGGAIGSPQILLRSGVGNADELSKHGLACVINAPDVGQHLQDHIGCAFEVESLDPRTFERTLRADRFVIALAKWWLGLPSPVAAPPVIAMGILRTKQGLTSPDMRMLISAVSMGSRVWFPGIRKGRGPCAMVGFSLCYPKSRGHVSLNHDDLMGAPSISYNALGDEHDVQELARGYRLMREFLQEDALKPLFRQPSHLPDPNDFDAVAAWIRQTAMITHHPVGTCRMGTDPLSVVDSRARVRGASRLRVVDASIFPTQIGGNPNVPIMAIAEKIAEDVLASERL